MFVLSVRHFPYCLSCSPSYLTFWIFNLPSSIIFRWYPMQILIIFLLLVLDVAVVIKAFFVLCLLWMRKGHFGGPRDWIHLPLHRKTVIILLLHTAFWCNLENGSNTIPEIAVSMSWSHSDLQRESFPQVTSYCLVTEALQQHFFRGSSGASG